MDSSIIYCPDYDETLYVPHEETPKTQMNSSFRDKEEYNGHNRKAVNFAEDYLVHVRL